MTSNEFKKECSRIIRIYKRWEKALGLDQWDVHFNFVEDPIDGDVVGLCHADWEYLMATLSFWVGRTYKYDEAYLEEIIVHECCHAIVKEMQDWKSCNCDYDMKHEERVVTMLARAFIRTKKGK